MFGGIAVHGPNGLVFATGSGAVGLLDAATGALRAQFSVYPAGPPQVDIAACAVDAGDVILLADAQHGRVRGFLADGTPQALYGVHAGPGVEGEDHEGALDGPVSVVALDDEIWIACGGIEAEFALQRFGRDGSPARAVAPPEDGGWRGIQGLARVGGEVWVAETEGDHLRRFGTDGRFLGDVALPRELARPLRLAADGRGGVLLLLAPEHEEDREALGVARLDADRAFDGWVVEPGEDDGRVFGPFDLAVFPDGSFAVADLPFERSQDVRVQLFDGDGGRRRCLIEDSVHWERLQQAWFQGLLAAEATDAPALAAQARVHHLFGGAYEPARALYERALAADGAYLPAALGLGALLQGALGAPAEAEAAYERALSAGGDPGEMRARIAECRHDRGDLDGAIALLQQVIEGTDPPERVGERLDALGTWFLERAGEEPETVI